MGTAAKGIADREAPAAADCWTTVGAETIAGLPSSNCQCQPVDERGPPKVPQPAKSQGKKKAIRRTVRLLYDDPRATEVLSATRTAELTQSGVGKS